MYLFQNTLHFYSFGGLIGKQDYITYQRLLSCLLSTPFMSTKLTVNSIWPDFVWFRDFNFPGSLASL